MSITKRSMIMGQKGFSLVELMIVVAIIGILTAVAVPNFQRFQLKSRQSEAKNNLAALYAAEKSFYGEWSSYFADFRDVGFRPEGTLLYRVGFGAAGVNSPSNYVGGVTALSSAATVTNTGNYCEQATGNTCQERVVANGQHTTLAAGYVTASTATGALFTAGAQGDIRGTANGDRDEWTVDSRKQFVNVNNGVDP